MTLPSSKSINVLAQWDERNDWGIPAMLTRLRPDLAAGEVSDPFSSGRELVAGLNKGGRMNVEELVWLECTGAVLPSSAALSSSLS